MSSRPTPVPALVAAGRVPEKNAGRLTAVAMTGAAAAAAAVIAGRRRASAEDPCAATVLDVGGGRGFKVERPDGAVLDGTVVGPEDGSAVVLSHCWTGSRRTWDPVAARLVAAGRRVVLYDQRGHGASTMGPDAPTVQQLGEDLAAVLEAADVRDAVLAGHSMGGMTLLALAVHRPDVAADRVRAMVLAGTAGFGVAAGPLGRPALFLTGNAPLERLLAGPLGPALCRGTVGRRARRGHLVATRDAFLSVPTDVRRQFLVALQAMDLRAGLGGLAAPTTIVVGSRDRLTPPRLSRALASSISGARLVELNGAGHMLPYEQPDRLAELILSAGDPTSGGGAP